MAATSDGSPRRRGCARIDELCARDPQPRARPRRARGVPDRDVRRAARRGTARADRAGRVRRRGTVVGGRATGRTTSCSRRWPSLDSVTAQLLQVHSHALGIVSAAGQRRAARAACCPTIVAAGKLLASVGSEAKPSGKLADIARTELEERPGGGFRLTLPEVLRVAVAGADELLIWTAVPGAGPVCRAQQSSRWSRADAPEVEVIDEWDVMGMRATVSHSVRIADYEVPPERLIGEPGAWTRRDPRTFTLAFAANHIGQRGAALEFTTDWVRERPEPRHLGDHAGDARHDVQRSVRRAFRALGRRRPLGSRRPRPRRTGVDPRAAPRQAGRAESDPDGVRRLRRPGRFRDLPLERIYRDVRTFSLHYRDEQYMIQVGQAMLDDAFRAKGYAGASTFPESEPEPGPSSGPRDRRSTAPSAPRARRGWPPRSARREHTSRGRSGRAVERRHPKRCGELASEPPRELTGSSEVPSSAHARGPAATSVAKPRRERRAGDPALSVDLTPVRRRARRSPAPERAQPRHISARSPQVDRQLGGIGHHLTRNPAAEHADSYKTALLGSAQSLQLGDQRR